jgi:transcriptional regulator with XRE-family HTH domain
MMVRRFFALLHSSDTARKGQSMDVFLNELGARLRARRQQLKLSQTQVARSADRSKQLVSSWERGTAEMTASCLAKVSQTLSLDPGWLLFGAP